MEWMWIPFQLGLGSQPMHLDIICSLTVTQEFFKSSKICAIKFGGSGMMVDASVHRYIGMI